MNIPLIINKTQLAKELNISKQLLEHRLKKGLTDEQKKNIIIIFTKHLTNVK